MIRIQDIDGNTLFEGDFPDMKAALEAAVEKRTILDCASLDGASLNYASLDGARLDGARLNGARLDGASLNYASLDGASLGDVVLRRFRDDLWAVLSSAPHEATAIREALATGKINGSAYKGECACVVGTVANARKCHYETMSDLKPDATRLAEVWFMQIKPGDVPEKSKAAKQALEWVDSWIENMSAFGKTLVAVQP